LSTNIGYPSAMITRATSIDRGDRFLAEIIGGRHRAGCLALGPLSAQPRMVEELLAARGIIISHALATTPSCVGLRRSAGPAPARSIGAPRSSATSGISTKS
jgi:hypothetical protein